MLRSAGYWGKIMSAPPFSPKRGSVAPEPEYSNNLDSFGQYSETTPESGTKYHAKKR